MIKVFISQPMRGKSAKEILEERNLAISLLKNDCEALEQDVEILDSYFEDYNPKGGSIPLKYLAKSIEILADADILLCIGKWESARGSRIEHECAKQYGIKIVYWGE